MTRAGLPTSRVVKGLFPKVLNDLPAELRRPSNQGSMAPTQAELVSASLAAAHEELRGVARLLPELMGAYAEYAQELGLDRETKKRFDEAKLPLALHLWRTGDFGPEVCRAAVDGWLAGPVLQVKELLDDPNVVAALDERLEAEWVSPGDRDANPLLDLADHPVSRRHLPEETWRATLEWVEAHPGSLRALEGDFALRSLPPRRPMVKALGDHGKAPLDRSIETRTVRLVKFPGQWPSATQILHDEVDCATSPFGLASAEARAVVLLAGRLFLGRTFNALKRELHPDDTAQQDLLRRVWRHIWGLGNGTAGPRLGATIDEHTGDVVPVHGDSLGLQRLERPEQSVMARVWARAHSKDHTVGIDRQQASELISGVWESWLKDTVQVMGAPPREGEPVAADEPPNQAGFDESRDPGLVRTVGSLGDQLSAMLEAEATPEVAGLLAQIAEGDPGHHQAQWRARVHAYGWSPEELELSGIEDVHVVREYLRMLYSPEEETP